MPYLNEDRLTFFRHWSAPAPRATVVVLHGFGEHTDHYHRFAFGLNDAGLDVWGIDHAGHGLSAGERGRFASITELAERASALVEVATAANPRLPLVLIGHSLGGVTAALMTVRGAPVDALVLTGAPLSGLPESVPADPVMSTDDFYLDALENDPLAFDPAPAEGALWAAISECLPELTVGLPRAVLPTLFVNGEHDVFASPQTAASWASSMPKAELFEVPGGFHDIVNDAAHRDVAGVIVQFIATNLGLETSYQGRRNAATV